jgi:hypothetical protein
MREHVVITLDDVGWRLMRRMAGGGRKPCQPRQIGPVGDVIGDEADRLINEVGREVITALVGPGRIDVRVVRY